MLSHSMMSEIERFFTYYPPGNIHLPFIDLPCLQT